MVDFNNETTATRPRQDIVNIIILQRRQDTLDKYMRCKVQTHINGEESEITLADFSSSTQTLLEEVRSMLVDQWTRIKHTKYSTLEELEKDAYSDNMADIIQAYRFIDQFIYAKGITKTDTKNKIDFTDPEAENEEADL